MSKSLDYTAVGRHVPDPEIETKLGKAMLFMSTHFNGAKNTQSFSLTDVINNNITLVTDDKDLPRHFWKRVRATVNYLRSQNVEHVPTNSQHIAEKAALIATLG